MKNNCLKVLLLCLWVCLPLYSCQPEGNEEPIIEIPDKEPEPEEPTEPTEPEPEEPEIHTFIITPNENGKAFIRNDSLRTYQPGDTIYLRGIFTHVGISEIEGSQEAPIRISNYPGEKLIISNLTWDGGGNPQGVQITDCHHLIVGGEQDASEFTIEGSAVESARHAFFCLEIWKFSDHIEVKNMTIRKGGMGIMAKTNPEFDNPATWHPNHTLRNLTIHDVYISDVSEEGMYIGHTARRWGWDESGKGYNATDTGKTPGHTYVEPLLWENVEIYNNKVENVDLDGIQSSAIHGLHVYNNVVVNWGIDQNASHSLGISVGGRSRDSNVHDNLLYNGWGEAIQFFGEPNSTHRIHNNLIVGTQSSGIAVYDGGGPEITNNTLVNIGRYAIKANARDAEAPELIKASKNVFIETLQVDREPWAQDLYIRLENGARIEDRENCKFELLEDARVDPDNYYQPYADSPIGDAGYRSK